MFKRIGLTRNLSIISATIFTNLFARYTWYALLPLHLRSLGANELEVGAVFTTFMFARNLLGIVGGALGDRFGRRTTIALSTFAMGPFFALAAFATDWRLFAAMLTCGEVCSVFQAPPMNALIMESTEENRIARAFSFTEAAVLFGLVIGPLAGAGLISAFNIKVLIIFNGIILILTGIVRGIGLRDTTTHRMAQTSWKVRAAIDANVRWYIALSILMVASFGIVFGPFFAILARDTWHNNDAEINLLWAIGSFASFLGIFIGRLSDHWGGKRIFVMSAIGYGLMTMAWGLAPTWEWGAVPLVLAFLFGEAMFMAQQTIQAAITSPESRSSVIGVIITVSGVIGALGPTLGAQLAQVGGNSITFIGAGIAGLLMIATIIPIRVSKQTPGS